MPGMGPAPSENRRRRNADPFGAEKVAVTADGRTRGPALVGTYGPETREWYTTWRKSAQARAFTPTDWQRLVMLAPLVAQFFANPDVKLMAEIRQNEALLGATPLDRLRARIAVQPKDEPVKRQGARPAKVTAISDRRRRLIEG